MASNLPPSESWVEFYQQNLLTGDLTSPMTRGTTTDATVVSTSPAPYYCTSHNQTVGDSSMSHVSRPVRRRPRASRRNPTTVLNTDPTNFRAMVQQFTGGYANPTATQSVGVGSSLYSHPRAVQDSFNFYVGDRARQQNVSSEVDYRHFLQLQFQPPSHQQQEQQQQQQHIQDDQYSNDVFLTHMMRDSESKDENNATFGRVIRKH